MQESLHFGRFALECGVVTQEQLNWALEQALGSGSQMVSDVLVEAGVLSVDDLERVLLAMAQGDSEVANDNSSSGVANDNGSARAPLPPPPPPPMASAPPPADAVGGGSPFDLLGDSPPDPIRDTGPLQALGLADPAGPRGPGDSAPVPAAVIEPATIELATIEPGPIDFAPIEPAPIELAPIEPAMALAASPVPLDPEPVSALEETHEMAALVPDAATISEASGVGSRVTAAEPPKAEPGPQVTELMQLLETAAAQKASDLHLHAGRPPRMRLNGDFLKIPAAEVTTEAVEALLATLLDESQLTHLREEGQVDFAHTLPGVSRLRCNAYRHRFGTDLVMRLVSHVPPTLSDLGLPESLSRFGEYHQGIVLITGPSGCGKSSTLAALVNGINQRRPDHVLTVEDPIEYVHKSQRCNVNQRQTGRHTATFARALKAALREDPDVIAIGELRDLETIRLALTAAETGHLVLATMHTKDSIGTINRVIGSFPPDEQAQVRAMLSESLRAIVSQRLARKKDGSGRIPALEILISTTAVGNLIREQKTFQIPSILQSGVSQGMCLMDASLTRLLREGIIDREEALRLCENPNALG